jgi:hypothetical protein
VKAPVEFVLPLFGQAAGADDQAALQVAAGDQFLDEQAGHDGLAGARVVRQQEAQRLARQHGLIDGGDLVRQRIDDRGVHRQHRVEQVREADALGLGNQAEQRAVAVEAPGPALLDDSSAVRRGGKAARWRPCRRRSCRSVPAPRSQTTGR